MTGKTSIYAKLAAAREAFHGMKLKKTGQNKFAGYSYFELADFLIPGMDCMRGAGLIPIISFSETMATMSIHEFEGGGVVEITSPLSEANLKGCHPIQNVGACETYSTRYLWVAALQIVEHDAIDSAGPVEIEKPAAKITQKQAATIRDELAAVEADEPAFCKYMKVNDVEGIASTAFDSAIGIIQRKRKA